MVAQTAYPCGLQSGREDLNLRPHGPEPCALTGLRYAPKLLALYPTSPHLTSLASRMAHPPPTFSLQPPTPLTPPRPHAIMFVAQCASLLHAARSRSGARSHLPATSCVALSPRGGAPRALSRAHCGKEAPIAHTVSGLMTQARTWPEGQCPCLDEREDVT